eukprot:TRINITY_DN33514_c0_g1_i1.p1 TRINITY_DN33514_c0_g1~~TRINITY_DN33514_c0_g1_i1.p1  ORF type:complete len:402 (+),score=74.81 TRINITY_DN33514_c0_g1_i1:67-1272(+)
MGAGASVGIREVLSTSSASQLEQYVSGLDSEARSKMQHAITEIETETDVLSENEVKLGGEIGSPCAGSDFMIGQYVEAHSLKTAELNGKRGLVVGFQECRVRVMFAGAVEKALKASNLKLSDTSSVTDLGHLSKKSLEALRRIIESAGFPWKDCIQKDELVARASQAMDASSAAREVAQFGKVLPKLISLCVIGMDGERLYGPKEVPDDMLMFDIMRDIARQKSPTSVEVKLFHDGVAVDGKSCVSTCQADGIVELLCAIAFTTLTDTFHAGSADSPGGITTMSIMPCEDQDDFLARLNGMTGTRREINGSDFFSMLLRRNIMQLYASSKPDQAERLQDLIGQQKVVYMEDENPVQARLEAFVAGHHISCSQDSTAQRVAQDLAAKADDLQQIGSFIRGLF